MRYPAICNRLRSTKKQGQARCMQERGEREREPFLHALPRATKKQQKEAKHAPNHESPQAKKINAPSVGSQRSNTSAAGEAP
jgi:hypothetical protein